jgi:DNA repair protein RadA/Sms
MGTKVKDAYVCSACGGQFPQWKGQCPSCREWNTLELVTVAVTPSAGKRQASNVTAKAQPLGQVSNDGHSPYGTGLEALDRVLGKGLVPGAAVLVGGEPGIGKSTLLLQMAGAVAKSGKLTLYVSGEESLPQIKARGERLGVLHDNLLALSTSRVDRKSTRLNSSHLYQSRMPSSA